MPLACAFLFLALLGRHVTAANPPKCGEVSPVYVSRCHPSKTSVATVAKFDWAGGDSRDVHFRLRVEPRDGVAAEGNTTLEMNGGVLSSGRLGTDDVLRVCRRVL